MAANGGVTITVLGSGTSVGVPSIGCGCAVCQSADPRDNRLRPSVYLSFDGQGVLIDATPDFRAQALRARLKRIDAILLTHSHADHIMGLDDVRPFNYIQRVCIPVYGTEASLAVVHRCFQYVFEHSESESSRPKLETRVFTEQPFEVFGQVFEPVRAFHGSGVVHGFRFGNAAYLTDHSEIPAESMEKLRGLDVLFLDALRHRPHPTHSTVEQSLRTIELLAPQRTFFTHIGHDLGHESTERNLPANVRLAYDGLQVVVE